MHFREGEIKKLMRVAVRVVVVGHLGCCGGRHPDERLHGRRGDVSR
jgi:hypothetical protein